MYIYILYYWLNTTRTTHLKITETNFILQIFNSDILSAVIGINNYIKLIHVRTLDIGFIFQNTVSSMYIVQKYLCNVAVRHFQRIMKKRRFVASNGNCISWYPRPKPSEGPAQYYTEPFVWNIKGNILVWTSQSYVLRDFIHSILLSIGV
jgi:hypothetical protein